MTMNTIVARDPESHAQPELLRAAIQVFSTRRPEEVEIREIADIAGVDSSLIPFHGGEKEGIYAAALWAACRQFGQLAKYLPKPPGIRDRDAPRKAADSLRAHIRMLLSLSLGRTPEAVPEQGRDLEEATGRMVFREMSSPRAGLAPYLLEAIGPFADHLALCVRAMRPDLDEESLLRMGLSIEGQILFLTCTPALLPLFRDQPYRQGELDSLAEHYTAFCLKGLAG